MYLHAARTIFFDSSVFVHAVHLGPRTVGGDNRKCQQVEGNYRPQLTWLDTDYRFAFLGAENGATKICRRRWKSAPAPNHVQAKANATTKETF